MMWEASLSPNKAYSNYETVQKNVERRLSQQMVRNDGIFATIFDCVGPLIKLPK